MQQISDTSLGRKALTSWDVSIVSDPSSTVLQRKVAIRVQKLSGSSASPPADVARGEVQGALLKRSVAPDQSSLLLVCKGAQKNTAQVFSSSNTFLLSPARGPARSSTTCAGVNLITLCCSTPQDVS